MPSGKKKFQKGAIDLLVILTIAVLLGTLPIAQKLVGERQESRGRATPPVACSQSQKGQWQCNGSNKEQCQCSAYGCWWSSSTPCPLGCSGAGVCNQPPPTTNMPLPTNVPPAQPTNTPVPAATAAPVPPGCTNPTGSGGYKYCLDDNTAKECKWSSYGYYWNTASCSYGCSNGNCNPVPTSIQPASTPVPALPTTTSIPTSCKLTACISVNNSSRCYAAHPGCSWNSSFGMCCPPGVSPPTSVPQPTSTRIPTVAVTSTPAALSCEFKTAKECAEACGRTCDLVSGCYRCPALIPPTSTPTSIRPSATPTVFSTSTPKQPLPSVGAAAPTATPALSCTADNANDCAEICGRACNRLTFDCYQCPNLIPPTLTPIPGLPTNTPVPTATAAPAPSGCTNPTGSSGDVRCSGDILATCVNRYGVYYWYGPTCTNGCISSPSPHCNFPPTNTLVPAATFATNTQQNPNYLAELFAGGPGQYYYTEGSQVPEVWRQTAANALALASGIYLLDREALNQAAGPEFLEGIDTRDSFNKIISGEIDSAGGGFFYDQAYLDYLEENEQPMDSNWPNLSQFFGTTEANAIRGSTLVNMNTASLMAIALAEHSSEVTDPSWGDYFNSHVGRDAMWAAQSLGFSELNPLAGLQGGVQQVIIAARAFSGEGEFNLVTEGGLNQEVVESWNPHGRDPITGEVVFPNRMNAFYEALVTYAEETGSDWLLENLLY